MNNENQEKPEVHNNTNKLQKDVNERQDFKDLPKGQKIMVLAFLLGCIRSSVARWG